MKKGERTRRRIVECSAPVFNTKGYAGASMSDLVLVTGLEKGGIYNHFGSKEQLALEAFDYATGIMRERFRQALETAGARSSVSSPSWTCSAPAPGTHRSPGVVPSSTRP